MEHRDCAAQCLWPDSGQVYLDLFFHRRDDYAVQQPDGSYRPARSPVTADVALKHLLGEITLGSYVLKGDTCSFGVADCDLGFLSYLQRLGFRLEGLGLNPILELSRPGRAHLWIHVDGAVKGRTMRRLLLGACSELGIPIRTPDQQGIEIFPKQPKAEGYGNLIRGPLGIHRKTGEWYPMGDLATLEPLEPRCRGGQLILWEASFMATPADMEAAAREFREVEVVKPIQSFRGPLDISGLDILEWAQKLTALERVGDKFRGKCPFHREDEPSFYVYPHDSKKPHYHCFGCGVHGDAADLKARATGLPLAQVLKEASRA